MHNPSLRLMLAALLDTKRRCLRRWLCLYIRCQPIHESIQAQMLVQPVSLTARLCVSSMNPNDLEVASKNGTAAVALTGAPWSCVVVIDSAKHVPAYTRSASAFFREYRGYHE